MILNILTKSLTFHDLYPQSSIHFKNKIISVLFTSIQEFQSSLFHVFSIVNNQQIDQPSLYIRGSQPFFLPVAPLILTLTSVAPHVHLKFRQSSYN